MKQTNYDTIMKHVKYKNARQMPVHIMKDKNNGLVFHDIDEISIIFVQNASAW